METPQEVEVWYLLPALRKHLAVYLKKEGMKQKDIAITLSLTEPAVSQYLKKKRGETISLSPDMVGEVAMSARTLMGDSSKLRSELQRLLKRLRETRFICSVCHDHIRTAKDCEICYER